MECREANSTIFRRQCEAMVKLHKPNFLVLLKIKMIEHKHITETLHSNAQIQSAVVGYSSEIVIMWQEDILKLDNISITPQGIHVIVKGWLIWDLFGSSIVRKLGSSVISVSRSSFRILTCTCFIFQRSLLYLVLVVEPSFRIHYCITLLFRLCISFRTTL